jgi:hypothetical protein
LSYFKPHITRTLEEPHQCSKLPRLLWATDADNHEAGTARVQRRLQGSKRLRMLPAAACPTRTNILVVSCAQIYTYALMSNTQVASGNLAVNTARVVFTRLQSNRAVPRESCQKCGSQARTTKSDQKGQPKCLNKAKTTVSSSPQAGNFTSLPCASSTLSPSRGKPAAEEVTSSCEEAFVLVLETLGTEFCTSNPMIRCTCKGMTACTGKSVTRACVGFRTHICISNF